MMKAVIDRFEGDVAVLITEDGSEIIWPVKLLPAGAAEGVAVDIRLSVDTKGGGELKRSIKDLQEKLRKRP